MFFSNSARQLEVPLIVYIGPWKTFTLSQIQGLGYSPVHGNVVRCLTTPTPNGYGPP